MKIKVASLPHSWLVSDWPPGVTPNTNAAGRQLVRAHRSELIECGALCRVGRNLTILGEGYAQFLARKIKRVEGFKIAPNRALDWSPITSVHTANDKKGAPDGPGE